MEGRGGGVPVDGERWRGSRLTGKGRGGGGPD